MLYVLEALKRVCRMPIYVLEAVGVVLEDMLNFLEVVLGVLSMLDFTKGELFVGGARRAGSSVRWRLWSVGSVRWWC